MIQKWIEDKKYPLTFAAIAAAEFGLGQHAQGFAFLAIFLFLLAWRRRTS